MTHLISGNSKQAKWKYLKVALHFWKGGKLCWECIYVHLCMLTDLKCQMWGWWWGLRCCCLPLKRGTDPLLTTRKMMGKIPYYFLCQQQNICILNCTNISLEFLGSKCSFSVQHGMLHILTAEMTCSRIPELLSLLLPGQWPCRRASLLPLFSLVFSYVYINIFFTLLVLFVCFLLFLIQYIWVCFVRCYSRAWGAVSMAVHSWCLMCTPALVWVLCLATSLQLLGSLGSSQQRYTLHLPKIPMWTKRMCLAQHSLSLKAEKKFVFYFIAWVCLCLQPHLRSPGWK